MKALSSFIKYFTKDLTKLILNYIITLSVPGLNTYLHGHSRPIEPEQTCQDPNKPFKLFEVSNRKLPKM